MQISAKPLGGSEVNNDGIDEGLSDHDQKSTSTHDGSLDFLSQLNVSSCLLNEDLSKIPEKQLVRLEHLCRVCKQVNTKRENVRNKYEVHTSKSETRIFNSFDIQICTVPKTGSTFMLQVFKILDDDTSNVFEMSRKFAHSNKTLSEKSTKKFYSLPTVIMARNPYSRLYSAYIDRIFLPHRAEFLSKIRMDMHGRNERCGSAPTFPQFLNYIIENTIKRHKLNVHWIPIYSLCNPCLTKNLMIIKHESFVTDVDNLLIYLDASTKAKEQVQEAMKLVGAKVSVPGLIGSQWIVADKEYRTKQCLKKYEIFELLWRSFQSQGFIRSNSQFPNRTFKSFENITLEISVKLFMEEIERNGPTLEESLAQRKKYLVDAYKDIPTDVLNKIKAIYRNDFLLFDYDFDPPTE